jgi:hypothetical protein
MAKLFIFGIGGTGSRVIRSLVNLMASGVKMDMDEVVPIIIDPDKANGDLNRTIELIDTYQKIFNDTTTHESGEFFSTKIASLGEVVSRQANAQNIVNGFRFEIDGVQNDMFKDFIDFQRLPNQGLKDLTELLFSKENLDSDLAVGFRGNPNMGSVVLNQFMRSDIIETFARSVEKDDKIFVISSIFGGTGAAGFPLLVKNFRSGSINGTHYEFLKNSNIAALSVLPYFKVASDDESQIDSQGFVTKTKAALHYYHRNLSQGSLNTHYYIGDKVSGEYDNNEGSSNQKNYAHFVELVGALSVIDFAKASESQTVNGTAINPSFKEFGVTKNSETIDFTGLSNDTLNIIKAPLARMFYFEAFISTQFRKKLKHPYASGYKAKFNKSFTTSPFFSSIETFNSLYRNWIAELYRNKVAFRPFDINEKKPNNHADYEIKAGRNLFSLINGVAEKKNILSTIRPKNYELFIAHLNKSAERNNTSITNDRFIKVFSDATANLVNSKLF